MSDGAFLFALGGWAFALGGIAWLAFTTLGHWLQHRRDQRRHPDWLGTDRWRP